MLVKIAVIILFVFIVGNLASALVYLLKDQGNGNRTVRALTFRIGLSLAAFFLLILGALFGWIQPHGL